MSLKNRILTEQFVGRLKRLEESCSSVKAFDPRGMEGIVDAKQCFACRFKHYNLTDDNEKVCGRCGTPWMQEHVIVVKGAAGTSSRRVGEQPGLSEYVDLKKVLDFATALDKWGVVCVMLYDYWEIGGEATIADWASENMPNAPFRWNRSKVRRLIERGRTVIGGEYGQYREKRREELGRA